jgi:import inner membrane translocase subunit TIM8
MSPELQQFLMQEKAKAQMQQTVAKLTEKCWDTCVGAPGKGLSSREEACLADCSRRFIETTQVHPILLCSLEPRCRCIIFQRLCSQACADDDVVLCSSSSRGSSRRRQLPASDMPEGIRRNRQNSLNTDGKTMEARKGMCRTWLNILGLHEEVACRCQRAAKQWAHACM